MILRRFDPLFCSLKRVHADIFMLTLMNKTKDQISWVSSHDLYWDNKMFKRKRSIRKYSREKLYGMVLMGIPSGMPPGLPFLSTLIYVSSNPARWLESHFLFSVRMLYIYTSLALLVMFLFNHSQFFSKKSTSFLWCCFFLNPLQKYCLAEYNMYVAFSAASNVTGILTDTVAVAELCHKYGALSFWDYATGGPYLNIDMNPTQNGWGKNAIFFNTKPTQITP